MIHEEQKKAERSEEKGGECTTTSIICATVICVTRVELCCTRGERHSQRSAGVASLLCTPGILCVHDLRRQRRGHHVIVRSGDVGDSSPGTGDIGDASFGDTVMAGDGSCRSPEPCSAVSEWIGLLFACFL